MVDRSSATLGIGEIIGDKGDTIRELAAKHGAESIRVFGSVARGEAHEESDVDFLVRWDYERISSWGGVGLTLELEELLGRKVDVVSEKALHELLRERVLAEAVSV